MYTMIRIVPLKNVTKIQAVWEIGQSYLHFPFIYNMELSF